MPPTHTSAGLDWGNAKTSLAVWDPEGARMIPGQPGSPDLYASSTIAFRSTRGRATEIDSLFPVPDDWVRPPDAVMFDWLKRNLPRCGSAGVQAYIATPVLRYWRTTLAGAAHLSIAVPLEYAADLRAVMQQAARRAGFDDCGLVLDVVAAALAYVPRWRSDRAHWESLAVGREAWIVDAGLLDITLTVLHIEHAGGRLNFSILAGDRLAHLGGHYAASVTPPAVAAAVESAARRLMAVAAPSAASGRPAWHAAPRWIVPCGGAPACEAAVEALARVLPGAIVWKDVDPREVHSHGAAVHAACRSGALPHVVVTRKRPLIGMLVGGTDSEFASLTSQTDEPPCEFEGAFELPAGQGHPFELSLAAAPAGGSRSTGLLTWVLDGDEAANMAGRVVVIRGRLESWSAGTAELVDADGGQVLRQSEFQIL